jgi:phage-related protein
VKRLVFVGPSRAELQALPKPVRTAIGFALYRAQEGSRHPSAKPLKGFGGAGVLEIVEDDDGNTYRAVYTVSFPDAVYVLFVFQKKSTSGIATPKRHIDLIRQRFRLAEELHARGKGQEDAP